ncbi:unnamed protein product [Lactuca virosa]|uniref:S-adenosylmethionine synthetase N-terminal domain-containing protein n=1 Tax=Lactuca virosa TaxID=75947 RepID=A0AAU9PRM7_9ASTR|nr:unnamed protein product [Lactuca virosa]
MTLNQTEFIVVACIGGSWASWLVPPPHRLIHASIASNQSNRLTIASSPYLYRSRSKKEMETFLFTSESVNEGHPDKLCDQVSDAILDACLEQDPESKGGCETCTKTNMVMVFGEITTKAKVDYEKIVRTTCREIGFTSPEVGLDLTVLCIASTVCRGNRDASTNGMLEC